MIGTVKRRKIITLGEEEKYKYMGVLEADTIKQTEMKEKNQNSKRSISAQSESSSKPSLAAGISSMG